MITLDFDEPVAARMLAELRQCNPAQRLDTLAVVVKVFVERGPLTDATDGDPQLLMRDARGRVCCDMHNTHCEPPADLCCWQCSEAGHPEHADGRECVLTDATPTGEDQP